jgi:hypothetical protein
MLDVPGCDAQAAVLLLADDEEAVIKRCGGLAPLTTQVGDPRGPVSLLTF